MPLHEQQVEDWMEDALHEIEMCFSQLEQVGQGPIAGEMAMRLNRLLMPWRTWTLEWQCFNAAAERAQELYARTTPAASRNWERGVSPVLTSGWQETVGQCWSAPGRGAGSS